MPSSVEHENERAVPSLVQLVVLYLWWLNTALQIVLLLIVREIFRNAADKRRQDLV